MRALRSADLKFLNLWVPIFKYTTDSDEEIALRACWVCGTAVQVRSPPPPTSFPPADDPRRTTLEHRVPYAHSLSSKARQLTVTLCSSSNLTPSPPSPRSFSPAPSPPQPVTRPCTRFHRH